MVYFDYSTENMTAIIPYVGLHYQIELCGFHKHINMFYDEL